MPSSGSTSPRLPAPQQATSASNPRRRLACDRCHQQKLRCLRTVNPDGQTCDRCTRLSAECVYSPASRIGRPPLRLSSSERTSESKRSRARTSTVKDKAPITPTPPKQSPQPPAVSASEHDPLAETNAVEDFDMNDACSYDFLEFLNDPMPFDPINTDMLDPGLPSDFSGGAIDDLDPAVGGDPCVSGPEDCVRQLTSISLALHEQLNMVGKGRRDSHLDPQTTTSRLREYPIRDMFEQTQKLVSISERLADGSTTSDTSSDSASFYEKCLLGVSSTGSPQSSGNSSTGSSLAAGSTPDCRSTFSAPIERFSTSTTNITPFSNTAGPAPPRWDPSSAAKADTSVIFLMLSCHFSLIRLYTMFCSDLREYLLHYPVTRAGRLFPDLKLGSFQVLAGMDVEILLVVQVCTHMLDRLHKARRDCATAGLITSALMHAVQMHEAMEAQRDGIDAWTGISTITKDIRKLLRQKIAT